MKLKNKIMLSLLVVISTIIVFITYLTITKNKIVFLENKKASIENYSQLLSETVAKQIFEYDTDEANSTLKNFIFNKEEICKILIIDQIDNEIIAEATKSNFDIDDSIQQYNLSISQNNLPVAKLEVLYSFNVLDQKFTSFRNKIILMSFFLFLLLSLIQYLIISKFLNSLSELSISSTNIAKGNLNQSIPLLTNDELGILSKNFVLLRDIVQEKNVLLASKNKELKDEQNKFIEFETEKIQSESYLDNIINSMPSILIGLDFNGEIIFLNRQGEKEFDSSLKEIQYKPVEEIFPFLEKVVEETKNLTNNKEVITQKICIDEQKTFNVTSYLIGMEDIISIIIRMDNITDQIKENEAIIHAEKMLFLSTLTSTMSLEINNSLAGISQNAQVLERKINMNFKKNIEITNRLNLDLNTFKQYFEERKINTTLDLIMQSTDKASQIISKISNFTGKFESELTPENLNNLANESLQLMSQQYNPSQFIEFNKIKIHLNLDENLLFVNCNKHLIIQVLLNILKNSSEAMLKVKTENYTPTLNLKTYQENRYSVIEILDNGIGMTKEIEDKIFDPFFTTKQSETGLGISSSKYIITKKHYGKLEIESEYTKGTMCKISLPTINECP